MAAQYIDHNEFSNGLNALYARATRYIDTRFENLNTQLLADRAENSRYIDSKFEQVTSQLLSDRIENNTQFTIIRENAERLEVKIDAVEQQINARIDAVQIEVKQIKDITLANTKMLEAVMQNLNAMSENIRKLSEKR